jgi:cellobiose-specific phosphotransferase system component IIB
MKHGNRKAEVVYLATLGFTPKEIFKITGFKYDTIASYYRSFAKGIKQDTIKNKIRQLYNAGASTEYIVEKLGKRADEKYIKTQITNLTFEHLNNKLVKIQVNFAKPKEPFSHNEMDYAPRLKYTIEELAPSEKAILKYIKYKFKKQ